VTECSDAETDAIAAVLGGRRESFRVLVEAHQDRVWRLCLLMLGDAGLAEDAAQEAFVTAFRRLPLFSPERGSFGTWLLTISRNLCCNVRRKKMPVTLAILPDQPGETGSSPSDFACRKERFEALDAALAALPAEYRAAFILAEIEELPHAEIALIEDVPVGTVKSRLHRARLALRGALGAVYTELNECPP
jgi:RNA polymerase sigma-70 factor, ECF subfamily